MRRNAGSLHRSDCFTSKTGKGNRFTHSLLFIIHLLVKFLYSLKGFELQNNLIINVAIHHGILDSYNLQDFIPTDLESVD